MLKPVNSLPFVGLIWDLFDPMTMIDFDYVIPRYSFLIYHIYRGQKNKLS